MRPRVFCACLAARASRAALRLLGRGGTALPGKLALRVCPDLLGQVSRGVQTVLITGTNGKTTTTRMLCAMYDGLGLTYFTNRSGANLASGLAAVYLDNATLTGRPKCTRAVIECDEGALRQVSGRLHPAAIVVTNVFRDQLDRYGEVTHTLESIRAGILAAPEATVCLNADCSLTASLADDVPNPVRFFGLNVPCDATAAGVSDAPRCIRCGGAYQYRYHTYAHLGGFFCPQCGYERPEPDTAVTELTELRPDGSTARFRCGEEEISADISLPSVYNVCNAAAALCAAEALGLPVGRAAETLGGVRAGFGRMEMLPVGQHEARIILVKNPAGCDRALDYLATIPGDFLAVFCLNDKTADGTDVSWIWDADYERLIARGTVREAVVYGTRAGDMRLRLKYAGLDDACIRCAASLDELMQWMQQADKPVYLLPNYTSLLEVRERIAAESGGRKFWE